MVIKLKLTFQSKDVTSLLLGTSVPPFWIQCLKINWFGLTVLSDMSHILAVLSPDPLANKSVVGFQAQMKTSDSCPRRTVALEEGISIDVSTSMVSFCVDTTAVKYNKFTILMVVKIKILKLTRRHNLFPWIWRKCRINYSWEH